MIASFTAGDTIDVETHPSAAAGTLSQDGSVVSVIENRSAVIRTIVSSASSRASVQ